MATAGFLAAAPKPLNNDLNPRTVECLFTKVDPQFAATQGFKYRLSVLLGLDGFSFLVTHGVSRKIMCMSSYVLTAADLEFGKSNGWATDGELYFEQLSLVDLVHFQYQRIDVALVSNKFTVAPDAYMADHSATLMSAAHELTADERILVENVYPDGPSVAISIPDYVRAHCDHLFPHAHYHAASTVFLQGIMRHHRGSETRTLYIHFHRRFFEIAALEGTELIFMNAFSYSMPEDILYFVLFVIEQLGMTAAQQSVMISGPYCETASLSSQLRTYCGSVPYMPRPEDLGYGEVLSGVGFHRYLTWLNMPLCE